jgi:hypothetical protein
MEDQVMSPCSYPTNIHAGLFGTSKFPTNNRSLTEIFRIATVPEISEFSGEYFVHMLTGGLPNMRRFGHRKLFYAEGGKILGHNIISKPWGRFFLEAGVSDVDGRGVVVINYNREGNSFASKRIRDHVRCVEKQVLYIGRFNYIFRSSPRFLGYFLLSRT